MKVSQATIDELRAVREADEAEMERQVKHRDEDYLVTLKGWQVSFLIALIETSVFPGAEAEGVSDIMRTLRWAERVEE